MTFEILPHEGVGDIRFGHSPEEVHNVLKTPHRSFKRTPASSYPSDYFENLQLFVYYGVSGAEAIELASPAAALFQNVDLLRLSFAELTTLLSKVDTSLVIEGDGCTSKHLGIGAYAPQALSDPEAKPESVIIFAKGYYD